MASGRFTEAIDALGRACSVTKNAPSLMTKLGGCLLALNQYAEAETVLNGAIAENDGVNSNAWIMLSQVYKNCGWIDLAEVCIQQANKPKPDLFTSKFDLLHRN